MSTPLDKYRKPTEQPKTPGEDDAYVAHHTSAQARRLRIRRRKEACSAPAYAHLIDVLSDRETGKEISLIFTHAYVAIKGRNLQEIADQLAAEMIDWIEEYDPKRWPKPPEGEAFIESIEYTTRASLPASGKDK